MHGKVATFCSKHDPSAKFVLPAVELDTISKALLEYTQPVLCALFQSQSSIASCSRAGFASQRALLAGCLCFALSFRHFIVSQNELVCRGCLCGNC